MVDTLRPGLMPTTDRIQGLSLGGRVMRQVGWLDDWGEGMQGDEVRRAP